MNAAAKAYGNAQRFRKPTANTFGRRPTKTTIPSAKPKDPLVEVEAKVPSYAFADKQKGERDEGAEERGKEDESLREKQGKGKESEEQATKQFAPPTKKVIQNEPNDRGATTTAIRAGQEFENFWSLETSYDLEEITFTKANFWSPNSFAMFEILRSMQKFTTGSRIIAKHHPDYIEYGAACYYAILFYLQILRAREAANKLSGDESTFLRRFRRKYAEESLPIAGPLVPFFSSIVSVLLPDSKYNWIVPQISPIFGGTAANRGVYETITAGNGSPFIQPHVLMMLSILREAIEHGTDGDLSDVMSVRYTADTTDTNPVHFDNKGYYVTSRIPAGQSVNIFGVDYRMNQTAVQNHNGFFSMQGVSYPFDCDAEQLAAAARHWQRSPFGDLALTTATGNHATNPIHTRNIEEFLHMPKSSNLEFFETLKEQAVTQARFYTNVSNLSLIPTSGGNEVLIDCMLRKNAADGTAIDHTTVGLGIILAANTAQPWYPQTFRNMMAGFKATRYAVERTQTLQAFSFGANASIYVTIGGHRIGNGAGFRDGEFWNNTEWTLEKYRDQQTAGKPMFGGWTTMMQEKFVRVKPDGY